MENARAIKEGAETGTEGHGRQELWLKCVFLGGACHTIIQHCVTKQKTDFVTINRRDRVIHNYNLVLALEATRGVPFS